MSDDFEIARKELESCRLNLGRLGNHGVRLEGDEDVWRHAERAEEALQRIAMSSDRAGAMLKEARDRAHGAAREAIDRVDVSNWCARELLDIRGLLDAALGEPQHHVHRASEMSACNFCRQLFSVSRIQTPGLTDGIGS